MVSILWSVIALSSGLLAFFAPALLAQTLPIDVRLRVGRWYYGMAMKSYRQVALVWRTLGGPELLPVAVDDELKVGKVTLDSGLVSEDKTLPFKDPDDRLARLQGKPLAIVPESFPIVVDAEFCEVGHWLRQHDRDRGIVDDSGSEATVNPWVRVADGLRTINPMDAGYLVPNGVEPENVQTCEELTKERFSKYGTRIGAAETLGTLMGFGVGAGSIAGFQYVKNKLLDGGGSGSGTTIPIDPAPGVLDVTPVFDALVVML